MLADFAVNTTLFSLFSFLPLQMQLKQAIKLGSPPSLMCVKRIEDGGAVSEDDGLPCSPPEYAAARHAAAVRTLVCPGKTGRCSGRQSLLTFNINETSTSCLPFCVFPLSQAQRSSGVSLEGADSDDDQVKRDKTVTNLDSLT